MRAVSPFCATADAWRRHRRLTQSWMICARCVLLNARSCRDEVGLPRFDGQAWQHHQAISPASRRIRQKVRGRTKAEVREKLQALHRELEAGLRVSVTYTVASCIRDWLGRRTHDAAGQHRRELPASC